MIAADHQIKGASHVRDMLADFCSGSTRLFLMQTILKKMIFPLPPLAEQKQIVEKLEKLMAYCDELVFRTTFPDEKALTTVKFKI